MIYRLYHASNVIFEKFDSKYITLNNGDLYGYGFYFSNNLEYVKKFGKYIYTCEVEFENPIDLRKSKSELLLVFEKLLKLTTNNVEHNNIIDLILSGCPTTAYRRLRKIIDVQYISEYDGVIGECEEDGYEFIKWSHDGIKIINVK